jgi:AcrR family transcriptional regulator
MGATSSIKRLKAAREQAYRTHILDVAEEVFAEFGYDGAQVKVVASRAQISLATLYGHFENKTALYRGVHARRLDDLMERLGSIGRDHADPLDQMLAAMSVYVAFHMEHPGYLQMHLREGNAWSEAHGLYSPEQVTTWRRGLERMAATFEVGMSNELFVRDDPMLTARTTNLLHQAALSHWVEKGMKATPGVVLRRLNGQFIRTFCVPGRVMQLLAKYGLDSA